MNCIYEFKEMNFMGRSLAYIFNKILFFPGNFLEANWYRKGG